MRVLVTGGSSDIGQAILTDRFRYYKDEIIFTASSKESLCKVKEKLEKADVKSTGLLFDLSDPEKYRKDWDKTFADNPIEGLVLNAAQRTEKLKLFHHMDPADIDRYVQANIQGNLWAIRYALPQMIKQKFGRIVFISSLSAASGTSRYGVYCLCKSAIEGLIKNLAVDYGRHNILSNIVRPGIIKTERTKRFWDRESYIDKTSKIIPQGELGSPNQIAYGLRSLMDIHQYINGETITISGGLPLMRSEGVLR